MSSRQPTSLAVRTSITPGEHVALAELAKGNRVLECGTSLGYSAIAMAELAECVWTVDHHRDWRNDSFAQLRHNLSLYGVQDKVVVIVGEFSDVLPNLPQGYFSFGFLDGFSTPDEVAWLITLMGERLMSGARLAVHDCDSGNVIYGLEVVNWRITNVIETLAILERR